MKRDIERGSILKRMSTQDFRESGALWFVNRILHAFGMAIVVDTNTGEMFPAWCRFRGFTGEMETKGFKNLSRYLAENAEDLKYDAEN